MRGEGEGTALGVALGLAFLAALGLLHSAIGFGVVRGRSVAD